MTLASGQQHQLTVMTHSLKALVAQVAASSILKGERWSRSWKLALTTSIFGLLTPDGSDSPRHRRALIAGRRTGDVGAI
jgi:hypothetical protein